MFIKWAVHKIIKRVRKSIQKKLRNINLSYFNKHSKQLTQQEAKFIKKFFEDFGFSGQIKIVEKQNGCFDRTGANQFSILQAIFSKE
ncbi:unnamed protein product [Paramecium sonneborni]|uniref:Uncharacterized protein n=1 Tax=Paramecium sonneborni TaxID=65129 RepID=A0A8S1RQL7_9CILI|nr:unnamed protein product [Paramecium sonneborni]